LRANLSSNFFEQTHVTDTKTESETMNKINVFMQITNAFLPNITMIFARGDYKKDDYTTALASDDYFGLGEANLHQIYLFYPLKLSFLVWFVFVSIGNFFF
jgi:hypothetical protein